MWPFRNTYAAHLFTIRQGPSIASLRLRTRDLPLPPSSSTAPFSEQLPFVDLCSWWAAAWRWLG
jgi:hypothetical protein